MGRRVSTTGVVTALDSNGFYIQDPNGDGNAATSDGIFVFTSVAPTVVVGQSVMVTGVVDEFVPNGAAPGFLPVTEIVAQNANVLTLGLGEAIAPVEIGGAGHLAPPTSDISRRRRLLRGARGHAGQGEQPDRGRAHQLQRRDLHGGRQ